MPTCIYHPNAACLYHCSKASYTASTETTLALILSNPRPSCSICRLVPSPTLHRYSSTSHAGPTSTNHAGLSVTPLVLLARPVRPCTVHLFHEENHLFDLPLPVPLPLTLIDWLPCRETLIYTYSINIVQHVQRPPSHKTGPLLRNGVVCHSVTVPAARRRRQQLSVANGAPQQQNNAQAATALRQLRQHLPY